MNITNIDVGGHYFRFYKGCQNIPFPITVTKILVNGIVEYQQGHFDIDDKTTINLSPKERCSIEKILPYTSKLMKRFRNATREICKEIDEADEYLWKWKDQKKER